MLLEGYHQECRKATTESVYFCVSVDTTIQLRTLHHPAPYRSAELLPAACSDVIAASQALTAKQNAREVPRNVLTCFFGRLETEVETVEVTRHEGINSHRISIIETGILDIAEELDEADSTWVYIADQRGHHSDNEEGEVIFR